uniref:Pantoate kinase n=1 Tax=uncultured euryarchaeote Alv-FOS1 TaxID=337892 RepID=Q3SAB5_9EURY|nr:predicted archaeal kinase [uncultured euryarchaeote Alv-FOS1]
MPMKFKAYAPGSVTLFFDIVDNEKPHLRGSRGVGVCVAPGAITEIEPGPRRVILNGEEIRGKIQRYVATSYGFEGTIKTVTALPISQGFGMSGAIALSTSLALAAMTGATYYHAARVAHEAELRAGSGLGDVASEFEGGFTFRRRAGIQPYGRVDRIFYSGKITLVVLGDKIETRGILKSESWRIKLGELGRKAMRRFSARPDFERALEVSRNFSFGLGLMNSELKEFLEQYPNAAMALFGNSAIVFGECDIPDEYAAYEVTLGSRATVLY